MRVFNPAKGVIVRERPNDGPPLVNGSREEQLERKFLSAAMVLLKKEDEDLGGIIRAALASAVDKFGEQLTKTGKSASTDTERVRAKVETVIERIQGMAKGDDIDTIKASVEKLRSAIQELKAADNGTSDLRKMIERGLEDVKQDIIREIAEHAKSQEAPEKPKSEAKKTYTATVASRDNDGRVKTVKIE